MKVFYVSTCLSEKKYNELFNLCNGNIRHSIFNFHTNILKGLSQNDVEITAYSGYQISRKNTKKIFIKSDNTAENNIIYKSPFIINFPIIKHILTILFCLYNLILWAHINKNEKKSILIDASYISLTPFVIFFAKLMNIKITGIVADIYDYMSLAIDKEEKKSLLKEFVCTISEICWNNYDSYVLLTEKMNDIVNPKNKPYTVVEGIINNQLFENVEVKEPKKKIIMYTGGIYEMYGLKNLIEGFKNIKDQSCELHLYGNTNMKDYLEQSMQEDKRIKCFGSKSSEIIRAKQKEAYILVNPRPTDEEYTKYSFPSKTLEYMASGNIVVSTKLDGIPNEYEKYINYFDATDALSIQKKLEELLDNKNKEKLLKKSKLAREFVLKNKNNVKQCEKIIKVLKPQKTIKKEQIKNSKNENIYLFIVLFLMFLLDKNTLISIVLLKYEVAFIIMFLLFIPIIYMAINKKISISLYKDKYIIFFVCFVILSLLIKQDYQAYNYTTLFNIFMAFLITKLYDKKKLLTHIIFIITFLAFYSLIGNYIIKPIFLYFIHDDIHNSILFFDNSVGVTFINLILAFPVAASSYIRNFGIYTEPGYFQFYLIAALIMSIFSKNLFKNKSTKFYIITTLLMTLISTFSTAGFIVLFVLLLAFIIELYQNNFFKTKKNVYKTISIFIVGFIILAILISNNSQLLNMINMIIQKLTSFNNSSTSARVLGIMQSIKIFIANPFFGVRFMDINVINNSFINTNFVCGALYGIIPFIMLFLLQLNFIKKFKLSKLVQFVLLVAFILSVNNHFFLGTMTLWIILLANNQDNKEENDFK